MRCAWLLAVLVVGVASAPAVASAQVPVPVPALAQYVESMPTSAGPVVVGTAPSRSRKLPSGVRHEIATQGGTDAATLEAVASSSTYGAPQTRLRPSTGRRAKPGGARSERTRLVGAAWGAREVRTDGGNDRRLPMLAGFMVLSAAGMALGARRARR